MCLGKCLARLIRLKSELDMQAMKIILSLQSQRRDRDYVFPLYYFRLYNNVYDAHIPLPGHISRHDFVIKILIL